MAAEPPKRQKREEYKRSLAADDGALPKKKFFRQRAHANPFSDHALTYPKSPAEMDWASVYPAFAVKKPAQGEDVKEIDESRADGQAAHKEEQKKTRAITKDVEIADIGCGFGGLLFALSTTFPDTLSLVTEYVQEKIRALRSQNAENQAYQNIGCLRANTMKFLPNFFRKHQLRAIFLCFPDPHFKQRKHKARIVSSPLCSEYAYVMKPGGYVYTITDVRDLHEWMVGHFAGHASWARVEGSELAEGEVGQCVATMSTETEEGKKVTRNNGQKFIAVFRRVEDPAWLGEEHGQT
ncbi:hypothetical protein P171DRAFT_354269 [Karstenula rhodostoma CBS 690.94]|uniref:tRNA (guanine-N(7)-)-methyltransferase n=1 Tax=Karstenula rhodostoma CBS 690.94 TaxID=1392251 RepID=A0A9P4UET8_9PLEO|nr:hypothetical protein P171DRAFT_354269 [Karstenula rhodostoma CBS 690.94]